MNEIDINTFVFEICSKGLSIHFSVAIATNRLSHKLQKALIGNGKKQKTKMTLKNISNNNIN